MPGNKINQERIAYWLDLAQYDMDTAVALFNTGRFLYVGFMCHQVIEKTLKACYVKLNDGIPPYSHNLRFLANESKIFSEFSEYQKHFLEVLAPLNIEARYPDYKMKIFKSLTAEKCGILMNQTEELYQWLRKQLLNL